MPFEPGKSGNPKGDSRSERIWRSTLMRACKQEDFKRVRGAAEKLLDLAEAGEQWAIKELGDRLDGKPAQTIAGDPENPLVIEQVIRKIVDPNAAHD